MSLSPTPEQVTTIVQSTAALLRALQEAALVEGLPPSPLLPATVEDRKQGIVWHLMQFEKAMNPFGKPLSENALGVSDWSDGIAMLDALRDLGAVRRLLLGHWGLEQLVGAQSCGVRTVPPGGEGKGLPSSWEPGHVHLDKPFGWPPPIPLAWWQQAKYSFEKIAGMSEALRIQMQPNSQPRPACAHPSPTPPGPPMATGLLPFDLTAVFRCAVELAAAIADGADGVQGRKAETAGERLTHVLNPRKAKFPYNHDWETYKVVQEEGAPWHRGAEPRLGWSQELDLADGSGAARQALLTLGLALADLRGDPLWHERGRDLLSAGTWQLWEGMEPPDRHAVRALLRETHRLWDWPSDPTGEPGPFTGPTATMRDPRTLTPGWRTVTAADAGAVNDLMRIHRERRLEMADRLYPSLPTSAPDGTPPLMAGAYESTAAALAHACYLKLHVLPVAGGADRRAWSEHTRQARLELPWGQMTVEEAARQVVRDRDQARAKYGPAEAVLLAAVEAGGRCAFADALSWVSGVGDVCEDALAGRRPWDQAACAMYVLPAIKPLALLEEMRRQTSRAALRLGRPAGTQTGEDQVGVPLKKGSSQGGEDNGAGARPAESFRPHPDGVEGGCWLWWQGHRYDIPKGVVYRLLEFMWNRDSASYDSLDGPVFEVGFGPKTVRARASEANKFLQRIGIPWRLKPNSNNRYLTKQTAG